MPIYWGDYLKDTMHLQAEAHGAYLLLLGHCWNNDGYAPNDDRKLKSICRISHLENPTEVLDDLDEFFVEKDDKIYNKRLLKELKKAEKNRQKKSEAGKKSGISRRSKVNTCSTDVRTKDEQKGNPSPSPSPSPSVLEEEVIDKSITRTEEEKSSAPTHKKSLFMKEEAKKLDSDWKEKELSPANVIEMWNVIVVGNNNKKKRIRMTTSRKQKIIARTQEELHTGQHWYDYFDSITKDEFCMGRGNSDWTADIDWALRPSNLVKMLEGGYGNG